MRPYAKKIVKPWGYEIIITPPDSTMVGKIAFTKAGKRWSFQYHDLKEENICLLKGKAEIWLENDKGVVEKMTMTKMKGYQIKPFKKHRFCAVDDCFSFEVSTKEEGNTFRLEDDYRRPTETEVLRKQPNRGWKEN